MTTASPERRRRTRAEQRAETRARLVEAAGEVFAAHGFEGASIDEITERAGYTRGAFYSNFTDKAELLIELSEARMAAFAASDLPPILAADEPDRVREAARWLVEQPAAIEVLLLVELARLREDHDDVAALLDRFTAGSLAFVERILDVAATGETPPAGNPERDTLARALLGSVLGIVLLRHLGVEVDVPTAERMLTGALRPAAAPAATTPPPADPAVPGADEEART